MSDSNVIQLSSRRPPAATDPRSSAPAPTVEADDRDTPPTPTELTQAQLFWDGYLTSTQLEHICNGQIRAGRAIDATNPTLRNRPGRTPR